MDEGELQERFLAELTALEQSGAVLPLELRPSQAWYLLAGLQLALRHPGVTGGAREGLDALARNIEGRLCRARPAMQEVARMGWNETAAEERRKGDETAASPPATEEPEPEAGKRKPERTAENKQIEPPENKAGKGRKRK